MNQARNRTVGNTLFMGIANPAHVIRRILWVVLLHSLQVKCFGISLFSWFVYERIPHYLINSRVLKQFAHEYVGLCPFNGSTVRRYSFFTNSRGSIRF